MNIPSKYTFTSQRLGFRRWNDDDIVRMHNISSDTEVMEFFPGIPTREQTAEFVGRMNRQLDEKGYCYFAVDILESSEFIGFIGISEQKFESDFTPCVDIGWRICKKEWNKGYATEGAERCLDYAFIVLKLEAIYSVAPKINLKSQRIMEKIGMKKLIEFEHPLLIYDERLRTCVLYFIEV